MFERHKHDADQSPADQATTEAEALPTLPELVPDIVATYERLAALTSDGLAAEVLQAGFDAEYHRNSGQVAVAVVEALLPEHQDFSEGRDFSHGVMSAGKEVFTYPDEYVDLRDLVEEGLATLLRAGMIMASYRTFYPSLSHQDVYKTTRRGRAALADGSYRSLVDPADPPQA